MIAFRLFRSCCMHSAHVPALILTNYRKKTPCQLELASVGSICFNSQLEGK